MITKSKESILRTLLQEGEIKKLRNIFQYDRKNWLIKISKTLEQKKGIEANDVAVKHFIYESSTRTYQEIIEMFNILQEEHFKFSTKVVEEVILRLLKDQCLSCAVLNDLLIISNKNAIINKDKYDCVNIYQRIIERALLNEDEIFQVVEDNIINVKKSNKKELLERLENLISGLLLLIVEETQDYKKLNKVQRHALNNILLSEEKCIFISKTFLRDMNIEKIKDIMTEKIENGGINHLSTYLKSINGDIAKTYSKFKLMAMKSRMQKEFKKLDYLNGLIQLDNQIKGIEIKPTDKHNKIKL